MRRGAVERKKMQIKQTQWDLGTGNLGNVHNKLCFGLDLITCNPPLRLIESSEIIEQVLYM